MRFITIFALTALAAAQTPVEKKLPSSYGSMEWVDPDTAAPEGMLYKTFHSATINGDVSYLIYLPPDYDKQTSVRYPVLYELPASGQSAKTTSAEITRRVNDGIHAGKLGPMIIVGVNGLRGNTMYSDSRDGKWPLEMVIIKDLIPHIDATYRTIASREGRAVDGFSMGGYGTAHLGFKFPEIFGVDSIMAPPLLGPELKQALPMQAWSRLFTSPNAMGGDMEYFRANDPFTLAEKNAAALRDRTVIRIVAHYEDQQWLWPQCEKLHQVLLKNMVPHEFFFLMNVKGHNRTQCLNTMGDAAFTFFSSSILHQAEGQGPATPAKKPRPRTPAAGAGSGMAAMAMKPEPQQGVTDAPVAPKGPITTAADSWEHLPDGSLGRSDEFHGTDGTAIPAYVRKPAGAGPFPIVVLGHGGKYGKQSTEGMGRSQKAPTEDFIKAGWAIYSIDYRPSEKIAIYPIEFDDTVEAVKRARSLPFVDAKRVGYMGGSHGGQVGSRLASRTDLSGAILCAPAAMDLIQDKFAAQRGEPVVGILKKMVADMEAQFGATSEEIDKDPKKYGYTSALTEAAQVRCPILIINGRDDDNSPVSIVELYMKKLRDAGKKVDAYLPDHGPHGFYFGRPEIPEYAESTRRAVEFFKERFR
jgi:dienelactone hydrolase/S-formylglutathione hydrolase FrmB